MGQMMASQQFNYKKDILKVALVLREVHTFLTKAHINDLQLGQAAGDVVSGPEVNYMKEGNLLRIFAPQDDQNTVPWIGQKVGLLHMCFRLLCL